jgi:hypothetical protein
LWTFVWVSFPTGSADAGVRNGRTPPPPRPLTTSSVTPTRSCTSRLAHERENPNNSCASEAFRATRHANKLEEKNTRHGNSWGNKQVLRTITRTYYRTGTPPANPVALARRRQHAHSCTCSHAAPPNPPPTPHLRLHMHPRRSAGASGSCGPQSVPGGATQGQLGRPKGGRSLVVVQQQQRVVAGGGGCVVVGSAHSLHLFVAADDAGVVPPAHGGQAVQQQGCEALPLLVALLGGECA